MKLYSYFLKEENSVCEDLISLLTREKALQGDCFSIDVNVFNV